MSSVSKTPHYNLSQFGDSPDDKPSWRGDYTGDMSKIDSQMYRNETDATTATSTANTAKTTADNALSLAQTNKADITEQESYFNALGVTSAQTAQSLMSTINGKAENTALTSLQGTVSLLSDTVNGKANAVEVYTKAQADARYTQQGGYNGTAQALDQRINTNASNITTMQSWQDAWHDWTSLGEFNYAVTPSQVAVLPKISNIKCYYNETLRMIKVFGGFGCESSSQNAPNFNSITIRSAQPLPAGMRPSSQINIITAMWWFMNGSGYNLYSYEQITSSRAVVIVEPSGYVYIGEQASSGTYSTSVGAHARQGARIVLPQSIYMIDQ